MALSSHKLKGCIDLLFKLVSCTGLSSVSFLGCADQTDQLWCCLNVVKGHFRGFSHFLGLVKRERIFVVTQHKLKISPGYQLLLGSITFKFPESQLRLLYATFLFVVIWIPTCQSLNLLWLAFLASLGGLPYNHQATPSFLCSCEQPIKAILLAIRCLARVSEQWPSVQSALFRAYRVPWLSRRLGFWEVRNLTKFVFELPAAYVSHFELGFAPFAIAFVAFDGQFVAIGRSLEVWRDSQVSHFMW